MSVEDEVRALRRSLGWEAWASDAPRARPCTTDDLVALVGLGERAGLPVELLDPLRRAVQRSRQRGGVRGLDLAIACGTAADIACWSRSVR